MSEVIITICYVRCNALNYGLLLVFKVKSVMNIRGILGVINSKEYKPSKGKPKHLIDCKSLESSINNIASEIYDAKCM